MSSRNFRFLDYLPPQRVLRFFEVPRGKVHALDPMSKGHCHTATGASKGASDEERQYRVVTEVMPWSFE